MVESFSIEWPLPYNIDGRTVSGFQVVGPHETNSCQKVTIFHEDEIPEWWPVAVKGDVRELILHERKLASQHWMERPPEPPLRTIVFNEETQEDEWKPGILKQMLAKAWAEGWFASSRGFPANKNPYEE